MNLVVTLEHRYDRTPDGAVWTATAHGYPFWKRYLDVFDHVSAIARVRNVAEPRPDWLRADGEGVSFRGVPYYIGPWQYVKQARQVKQAVQRSVAPGEAVLLRVGSQLARCLEPVLRRTGRPYGVEVVADPYDVFAPGAVRHPLRPFFRRWFAHQLRRQCAAASVATYVTENALQRRYPPGPGAFATYYSDVELPPDAWTSGPRPTRPSPSPCTLITVGTLAQLYKAQDVLIDAVAACAQAGRDIRAVLVGDGGFRSQLEAQASRLGIRERINFAGQMPAGSAVRAQLDHADLFVLPSRQEGLPRAMVEAMARGLPCIGSTVGGIPELLPAEDLVPPGDAAALARKIQAVQEDPQRLARMSARNWEKAHDYAEEGLRERRLAFYRALKEVTETSLGRGKETELVA